MCGRGPLDPRGRALLPVLEGITADMREASMATAFEADMVVCIARVVSGRSLSVDIRVGTQLDAYCTAHGKLWLAELGEAALRRYLEVMPLTRLAPHTIVDRDRLQAELAQVRRQGHAVNDGERNEWEAAIGRATTESRRVRSYSEEVEYQEQQARLAAARKKEGAALARGTGAADSGGEDDEPAVPRGGGARFV